MSNEHIIGDVYCSFLYLSCSFKQSVTFANPEASANSERWVNFLVILVLL